jgi:hypothetical protein
MFPSGRDWRVHRKRCTTPCMSNDDKDWKLNVLEAALADQWVQGQALAMAEAGRTADDPELSFMDVAAARQYVKTCVLRMSVAELGAGTKLTLAALWARGTLGAARYRTRRGNKGSTEPTKAR